MGQIVWREDFKTGIDSVDYEHETLVGVINELLKKLELKSDKAQISLLFGEIHARISSHFALEESLMRKYRYEGYADHTIEHHKLLDQILEILDRFENDDSYSYSEALETELTAWFVDHFKNTDSKLHKWEGELRAKGVLSSIWEAVKGH